MFSLTFFLTVSEFWDFQYSFNYHILLSLFKLFDIMGLNNLKNEKKLN